MKTILFITDLHTGAHVTQLAGVFDRAAKYGWRVIEIERDRTTRPLSAFFETWTPSGCIMECGKLTESVDAQVFDGVPVVYIDPPPGSAPDLWAVRNDAEAIARRAAKELSALECASYAYVGWCKPTTWSISRGEAFAKAIAAAGGKCSVWSEPWQDTFEIQKKLAKWLGKLKKPAGVFAANDYAAEQVAGACMLAQLESPSEVALVGVDNDELLCENSFPSMTSIELDFRLSGQLAADLLKERMDDPDATPRQLTFGPLSVHRRQSTRAVKTGDRRIINAVERIRRDATYGLKAIDVIKGIGLSRRLAERRFKEATGRTILEEIQEVRFTKAKELLRNKDIPIGLIAEKCGWESDSYLKRFFKTRTGMTPREWRQKDA